MADEIKHAQRTFALASAYGGRELGPGPLAIDGAFCGAASRLRLAEAVAREGCVAETLAAAEVRAASEAASDPVIRRVLAEIATDEEEHARLAWRTLNWLLEGLSSDAVSGVLEVLHHALDGALAAADGTSNEDASLEIFGVLSAKARGIVVRCAGEEIVRPCARAMSKAA
ncbi:MAG TPA: ferritin-like domain-containing protein [Nannocystis exedens]|nr:ferritin-like domain-containing protein [Nannocystis exedens]